jgi:DNA modification methylase
VQASVIHGDCLAVMPTLDAESVDAIVCDPPYGLSFMGKNWDHGIPGVAFWREALRVAKPGAHLVAFGGTRTSHRLVCAIEDAGWEIRDTLSWMYGSGFPKSLDVSKAMDKAAGVARETTGRVLSVTGNRANGSSALRPSGLGAVDAGPQAHVETLPATEAARQWAGWGTALKPAHEPVIVAQKPYTPQQLLAILAPTTKGELCRVGSYAETGTPLYGWLQTSGFWSIGGLLSSTLDALSENASRFTTETAFALTTDLRILKSSLSKITPDTITEAASPTSGAESSVWLAASISRSVLAKCERLGSTTAGELAIGLRADEEDAPAASKSPAWEPIILARKPLAGTVAQTVARYGTGAINVDACRIGKMTDAEIARSGKSGGIWGSGPGIDWKRDGAPATGRWPANVVLSHSPECNGTCDASCPVRLLDEQSGERPTGKPTAGTRGQSSATDYRHKARSLVGGGDTGGASRFFYCAKSSRREREAGLEGMPQEVVSVWGGEEDDLSEGKKSTVPRTNSHPTVKPLALMRWLCRLVTPPMTPDGKPGLILDPFAGSGSTGCAAALEGFRFLGIEQSEEYVAIAERRIAHWATVAADTPPELEVA